MSKVKVLILSYKLIKRYPSLMLLSNNLKMTVANEASKMSEGKKADKV